jgi:hypothetical protein
MQKGIKALSVDAQEIYKRLVKLAEGETITYQELSDIIGRDIQKHRNCLYTAYKMALKENRMVFDTIRDEGIRRLKNDEIPNVIGTYSITRIRRTSRRGATKIVAADYNSLSNEMKVKHNAHLSVLGAFIQMTKQKAIERIETAVRENEDLNKITYARTLEQFKTI